MGTNRRKNSRIIRNNSTPLNNPFNEAPHSNTSEDLRSRIAKEAAFLLYFGSEKEYKQAKVKAAQAFRTKFLPSNLEIALELDKIAEENEGPDRIKKLIEMRKEALQIMKTLKEFHPLLIGSVWRGTIRCGSDIDISVYHDEPREVIASLKIMGLELSKTERIIINKHSKIEDSFHIYTRTCSNHAVEITVRSAEEANKKRKCETFGDEIKGLTISELDKILQINPAQKFLPS